MKQPTKIITLLICIFLCSCMGSFAFEESEALTYITEDFPPYNYVENGTLKGLSVDLLKMIWSELGLKPQKINMLPWSRGYNLLKNRPNTVLFSTAKTEERAEMFKWACPISVNTRTALIALKTKRITINSIDDAKKFKIGTLRNDAAEQILLSMGFNHKQIDPVSSLDQNIRKLDIGRIDMIAFNEYSFYNMLDADGIRRNKYETIYLVKETIPCYAFSRDVPDNQVRQFQNALDKIRKSPEYQKLIETYLK